MTVGDRVAEIPAVLPAVIGKLNSLGDDPDKYRYQKNENFIANHRGEKSTNYESVRIYEWEQGGMINDKW